MRIIGFITILVLIASMVTAQGLKTAGSKIIDENGDEVILRGIGLGGWMLMEGYMMQSSDVADTQHEFRDRLIDLMGEGNTDDFFDAWLANHVTRADIDSLAIWGYNSVRLPMHYNLFTLPIEDEPVPGQNTWLEKGFDMVDSLLFWCASNEIYLILDMHAAPGGQGYNAAICDYDPSKPSLWESEANRDKTVALWQKLAARYSGEPWIGGYDLLNEVNWDLPGNVMLRNLYEEITDSIRTVDTEHILFIEGNWFANDFTGLTPPWDDNMAYSFHKYWNYNDPGSIQWVLDLRDQHNVPLWMGEGGENSNVWFTDAITLFESNGIGWSWWPMKRIETIVSPYSIPFTQGYKDVLAYWRGEGPQPTASEAFQSMMELALSTNSMNCLYRKDVHDAKIRQVSTEETLPYSHHEVPGIVYLSDFDLGRLGIAYLDHDYANYSQSTGQFQAWNSGWMYRNDGVDIEANNDAVNSNGYHIGFVQKGEWMNYSLEVADSAAYAVRVRVASESSGGEFHLALDGQDITETASVNSTGSWFDFSDVYINDVILYQGEHVLTLSIDNDVSFNISSLEFTHTGSIGDIPFQVLNGQTAGDEISVELTFNHPVDAASLPGTAGNFQVLVNGIEASVSDVIPKENADRTIILSMEAFKVYTDMIEVSYSGNAILSTSGAALEAFEGLVVRNTLQERSILPDRIQAEDFIFMIGMGTEETTDLGGGLNLGWTDAGDFADYLIYNAEEGFFQASFRVAATSASGLLGLYLLDQDSTETELCYTSVPATGGWQTWTTVSENFAIPPGPYILRMKVHSGGFNLNWIDFALLDDIGEVVAPGTFIRKVYPSPVKSDMLYVEMDLPDDRSADVEIFDLMGNRVSSGINSINNSMMAVRVSSLSPGAYLLRIAVADRIAACRFIRQ